MREDLRRLCKRYAYQTRHGTEAGANDVLDDLEVYGSTYARWLPAAFTPAYVNPVYGRGTATASVTLATRRPRRALTACKTRRITQP